MKRLEMALLAMLLAWQLAIAGFVNAQDDPPNPKIEPVPILLITIKRFEERSSIQNIQLLSGIYNPPRMALSFPSRYQDTEAPALVITDESGEILFQMIFNFPTHITVPMPEPPQDIDDIPAVIPIDEPEVSLVIPYFAAARFVRVFDQDKETPSMEKPLDEFITPEEIQNIIDVDKPIQLSSMSQNTPSQPGKFNILIIASGYTAGNMAVFTNKANSIATRLLNTEPFQSNTQNVNINAYENIANLGCYTGCSGIDRLLCCNHEDVIGAAANSGYYYDEIIVVHRTDTYAGGGSREHLDYYKTNSYTTFCTVYDGGAMLDMAVHEFGHSFGNLCDEYTYGSEGITYKICVNCRPTCNDWQNYSNGCQASCSAEPSYFRPENSIMLSFSYDNFNLPSLKATYLPDGLEERLQFFVDAKRINIIPSILFPLLLDEE